MLCCPQSPPIEALGIDLVEISRIENLVRCCDRETLALVFSPSELDASQKVRASKEYLSICFATKEAIGKALGTGLAEINWFDITVQLNLSNRLTVSLSGLARQKATNLRLRHWEITWFSWKQHILVCAIAW